jgi:predicted Mrr-cat superfamily restriction endonuclease
MKDKRVNYWLLSAGKDGELSSPFWLEKVNAIGWSKLGDLTLYPRRKDLEAAHRDAYPEKNPHQRGGDVSRLWSFCHLIQPGELVFIRSYAALIGIGEVQGGYEYLAPNTPLRRKLRSAFFEEEYPHIRRVRWLSLGGGMKQSGTLTRLTLMS